MLKYGILMLVSSALMILATELYFMALPNVIVYKDIASGKCFRVDIVQDNTWKSTSCTEFQAMNIESYETRWGLDKDSM